MTISEHMKPIVAALSGIDPTNKFQYAPYIKHIKKSIKFCLESQTGINVEYAVWFGKIEFSVTHLSPNEEVRHSTVHVTLTWTTNLSGEVITGERTVIIPVKPTCILKIR